MLTLALLWSVLIVPWLTLFLLKKDTVKRYFPVAVFTALLVTIVFEMAYSRDWWDLLLANVAWGNITNVPFVYGVFFVGTIWIFYLSYPNFWIYMLVNALIDALHIFLVSPFILQGRLYRLVRINELEVYSIMLTLAIAAYVYQRWQEGIFVNKKVPATKKDVEFEIRNPFKGNREKIR
jgi:hypothetical protein